MNEVKLSQKNYNEREERMTEYFEKLSPHNNKKLYDVEIFDDSKVDKACLDAKRAFTVWSTKTIAERKSILKEFLRLIEEKQEEIVEIICYDTCKPKCEAITEVVESCDIIKYFLDEDYDELFKMKKIEIDNSMWPNKSSFVKYEPVGVYAILKPWNYPFEMTIWAIIPILIAGNTVVYKPSEYSTKTGLLLYKLLQLSKIPDGVVNIVTGNYKTGAILVRNNLVDAISFTGSTIVGKDICTTNKNKIKNLNLELGGSDYAIVLDDANIELAVKGIVWGAFSNAGQVCVATEKILVKSTIYDKFIEKFKKEIKKLRLGIEISPLISKEKFEQVNHLVNEYKKRKECKVFYSDYPIGDEFSKGNYVLPTLIELTNNFELVNIPELFAPIVFIASFENSKELAQIINESSYGLGCSLWTNDPIKHEDIINSLQIGMIWINEVNLPMPQVPWVGTKDSSIGFNLSRDAVKEAMKMKIINYDTSNQNRDWWYPYKEDVE